MSQLLRDYRYDVATVASVRDALDTAAARHFDLVISDIGLPDGSGLELMSQLRRLYHLKGIALSGYGMEEDIRRSHEAGFAAHLVKPVDFETLREAIHKASA